jgi:Ser-tRNA(Ala) deacylase AlaX
MENTKLMYLNDSYLFTSEAEVIKSSVDESGRLFIILNQSIFYPQGGGQQCDIGVISAGSTKFIVNDVRFIDGVTYHYGIYDGEEFFEGDTVSLDINESRRRLSCRLHSAGHLLDYVFQELTSGMTPLKGFHFPEGSYVEYEGDFTGDGVEMAKQVEEKMNILIQNGFSVKAEIVSTFDELKEKSYFIPQNIPANKPIRVVTVYGEKGIPCGGTHVNNINEICRVLVTKIKSKGGNTRVSYQLVD